MGAGIFVRSADRRDARGEGLAALAVSKDDWADSFGNDMRFVLSMVLLFRLGDARGVGKGAAGLTVDDTPLLATLARRSLRPSLLSGSLFGGDEEDQPDPALTDEGAVTKPAEVALSVGEIGRGVSNDVEIGGGTFAL